MPNYNKSIVVSGAEFVKLIKLFTDLVADKSCKPVPYKDYTRLKKYNKEVTLRFSDEDGAVMIVPTEPGVSLLYWTKKGDNSLGDFLWSYFYFQEVKEMHHEEKQEYDLFGLASKADYGSADACTASEYISKIASDYDKISSESLIADHATAISEYYYPSNTQTGISTGKVSDTWMKIETPYETLSGEVQKFKDEMSEKIRQLEEKMMTKPSFEEMDYNDKCVADDVLSIVDEARYDIQELYDEIDDIKAQLKKKEEMKVKEAAEDTRVPSCIVYDKYGVPHEVQGSLQSTSSNCYPAKNFKINVAAWDTPCSNDGKEKENMDTAKMFNFDFGPVASHIRMSPYGLAMKNADGKFVSYDKTTGNIMDVEVFNFDAQKFLYKMPVAVNQVAVGDIVVHMRKPMFVRAVKDGIVSVIDIYNAEAKDILPVKSPFGFNFITKVVSLIDMTGADANSPFGNMLPLLMLGEGQDFKDILPLMMLTGNANMFGNMAQNPLMLYALMGDKNNIDPLAMAMLMGGFAQASAAPAHNCGCQNHNS